MAEIVPMLALSPTMEEAVIVKWHKSEGEAVGSGDILCEVETDKAVMEYEAAADGVLLKILLDEGDTCGVGDPIAIVGSEGEDVSDLIAQTEARRLAEPSAPAEVAPPGTPAPTPPTEIPPPSTGRAKASPVAAKLATQLGLDIRAIAGSGPNGRIIKRDVEAAMKAPVPPSLVAAAAPAAELVEQVVEVSPKRKMIADRMVESKFSAPHYYLTVTVAMDELMAARKRINEELGEKLSLNAFLMGFAARAVANHPQVNATWQGDTILRHDTVDVGLAVAQDDGLIAPVVRDCSRKSIREIDVELRALIAKAQSGSLSREDYAGATFTITNLGSYGIEQFTGVINLPGSAILAIGAIKPEPVVAGDGSIVVRSNMKMTLSCDHRVIDGAVGAAFLKDLKDLLALPVRPALVVQV